MSLLHLRTKKTSLEEESDPPQTELVSEVTNILDTLQVLNNHLRKAESFHKKLGGNKCKLEYDLGVKQNSIQIDSNLLFNREVTSCFVYRMETNTCGNCGIVGLSNEITRLLAKSFTRMSKKERRRQEHVYNWS